MPSKRMNTVFSSVNTEIQEEDYLSLRLLFLSAEILLDYSSDS